MKKRYFLLPVSTLLLTGCNLPAFLSDPLIPSAIQITTTPKADVYINDQSAGKTPISKKTLKAGTYKIAIKTDSDEWVGQLTTHGSTVSVINRMFYESPKYSAGEVITLEGGSGVYVVGTPNEAKVSLDQKDQGTLPIYIQDIQPGMHDLTIEAIGYDRRTLKIKVTKGYKLLVNVDLAKTGSVVAAEASPLPSTETSPGPQTPSPTTTLQATAKPSPTTSTPAKPTVTTSPRTISGSGNTAVVKQTPTGWLRIRAAASLSSAELGKVNVGEQVEVLSEQDGWWQVKTTDGLTGWASAQYLSRTP